MGVRILVGKLDGGHRDNPDGACLYCSTTGVVFGPLFADGDEAEGFLAWCHEVYGNPRDLSAERVVTLRVHYLDLPEAERDRWARIGQGEDVAEDPEPKGAGEPDYDGGGESESYRSNMIDAGRGHLLR